MKNLVHLIRPENYEQEVIVEKRPVLLLCMTRGEEFPKQLQVLKDVAKKFSKEMKVGWLQEEFIEAFKKDNRILGTPTFLILVGGKERGRMLGLADPETLTGFIENYYR